MKLAILLFLIPFYAFGSVVDYAPPVDTLGHWEFDLYDTGGNQRGTAANPFGVSAVQSGTWSVGRTWALTSAADSLASVQSGIWGVRLQDGSGNAISSAGGSLNVAITNLTGAATSANQSSEISALNQIVTNTASALTDTTASGNITSACTTPASCAATAYVNVAAQGQYTVGISVAGTFVGTYLTEGQNADGTWTTLPMYVTPAGPPYTQALALAGPTQFLVIGGAYQNIRVRAIAYTSGTIAVALDASIAQQAVFAAQMGTWSMNALPVDGGKASYSAAVVFVPVGTTPTDIFTITGSASKVVRITRLALTATQTTAAQRDVLLIKRSTADTGGTSSTLPAVPHDSANAAATAVVRSYTANPTATGAVVGQIRTRKVYIGTGTGNSDEFIVDFGDRPAQAIVLRGAGDQLAISLNSVASPGNVFDISIEWTEE